jgi:putative transposase
VKAEGRLVMLKLTPAGVRDAAGAERIITAIRKRWPWLKPLFADGAYDRGKPRRKAARRDVVIEIVRKLAGKASRSCPGTGWRRASAG